MSNVERLVADIASSSPSRSSRQKGVKASASISVARVEILGGAGCYEVIRCSHSVVELEAQQGELDIGVRSLLSTMTAAREVAAEGRSREGAPASSRASAQPRVNPGRPRMIPEVSIGELIVPRAGDGFRP